MTPEQQELLHLREVERLSRAEIAEKINASEAAVKSRLERARAARDRIDPAVKAGMDAVGTGMVPTLAWAKTKSEDGTSYSVLLKPEQGAEDTLERIRDAFEGMEPAKPVEPPQSAMDDLCAVYPLMDVHYGMHAWGRETGGPDYDIYTANADMRHAFAKVSALTPDCAEGVLILGGDFFHQDDTRAETPQSKHKLDMDGRHFKVLDTGIAMISEVISTLLKKHKKLTVRVLRGNHDTHSHLIMTFALEQRYRDEPRCEVEKDPRDLFMMQWGKSLISAHHGDRAKPERLTLYLSDVCPYWSETRYRYCFTGHVHHDQAKDVGPLRWESLRAFCPPDSYAAGMGYASRRALQSLTFDKRDGLVLRAIDPIERENFA